MDTDWTAIVRQWPWPLALVDASGTVLAVSAAAANPGEAPEAFEGRSIEELGWKADDTSVGLARRCEIQDAAGRRFDLWAGRPDYASDWSQRAQSERMAAIEMLAGGIAHEFNNMMSGLLGYAQLAEATRDVEDYQRAIRAVYDTAGRAKSVIGGLLSFAGRQLGETEGHNLGDVIGPIISMVAAGLRNDNIEVVLDVDERAEVAVDLGRIQQVLLNVVIHSRQAMVDLGGGVMTLAAHVEPEGLVVCVRDNAAADDSNPTNPDGALGSGMSISRELLLHVGGELRVRRDPSGHEYKVVIPVSVAVSERQEERESAEKPLMAAQPASIVIIDDESVIRELISHLLTIDGHRVRTAATGYAGVELARHTKPDLVIVDVHMPGMSGWDTFLALEQERLGTRVLMMTGSVGEEYDRLAESLKPQNVEILQKPFKIEELRHKVRAALASAPRFLEG